MNLSAPFIRRPIATTLLAIGLAIAGIIAFNVLPVSSLPQVEFPTISVQASLPGASAEIMATSVATPLETQLGKIAGVTEMTSSSSLGSTRVILQFDLSRNIDGAARDVQAALNAAQSQLPTNLSTNPFYRKVNPADAPIMVITLTSDLYSRGQMYDVASTIVQQKLAEVQGIGQVLVSGGSLPAIRIELNPNALNSYGISLASIANSVANSNVNLPKGQINFGSTISEITANDQIFNVNQYRPLIITYRNGNPVRLKDVGEVIESVEDLRNAGLANGKPSIVLILYKQPGANIIETVSRVNGLLPQLKASIPAAIDMTVVMDRTPTIRASLHDVEMTLIFALILVILVTYVFLGSVRAMLIPGTAVLLSLLGTFGVMKLLNYSLDNLSLMALTISTGFVVDDAVVMLENISRYIEKGFEPLQAAFMGAKEVGFTVLSMTISLIAVFIPILLMGGIVGRLFREFSMTLSIAIIISLIVSLTVTPMMCSLMLKPKKVKKNFYNDMIHRVKDFYNNSLTWTLNHPNLMLFLTLFTIIFNIFLFIVIPKGFFPQQDTGRIIGSIQAQQNISFQAMEKILASYVNIIQKDSSVQNVVGFIGGGTSNSGMIFISLKDLKARKVSSDAVINRLREPLSKITGSSLFLQSAQDLMVGGRQGGAQFQYTLSADNLADLNKWGPIIIQKLIKLPGIADVNTDQRNFGLQMFINIDRDAASRFGITPDIIDATLYNAFGQRQVTTLYSAMNQYHVVMEVAPPYWQYPETLKQFYVTSPAGNQVPLSAFASFSPSSTLLTVNHDGQTPSATLSFNLLPNVALGDAVSLVSKTIADMNLPPGIHGSFRGTAQAFQSSLSSEPYLILAALLTVYIVLGILYESLIHPITILSTLPSAGVGALLALLLTRTDLSIIALIGIILLIGIVKKNAIMMIDFALQAERIEKKSSKDSIHEAAILRFRPIMMTTMAAMLGALPLVVGFGVGSELRRPLGIAIVGGLIVSQILTLYSTPVIYLFFERWKDWWEERKLDRNGVVNEN